MNDAMRNAMDGFAANFAAHASNSIGQSDSTHGTGCLANTAAPRSLGVREIAQNNSAAMREILSHVDALLEALRGPRNAEACDGARVANPEGLLSEVNRQAAMLDEINCGIMAAIATLNG